MAQATKKFTRAQVNEHDSNTSLWIIIENNVYDVTKFINEHPGGEDSLLEYAGKDGTQAFVELVGHSSEARELLEKYLIGELIESEKSYLKYSDKRDISDSSFVTRELKLIAPLFISSVVIIGAFVAYRIFRSTNN